MILEKACWYLHSTAKQIHPALQCSFKLKRVTHIISLSCVQAWVVTYYTEVFSGNVIKMLVFHVLGWWRYPRHSVCFPFTEHRTSECTQNGQLADCEEIFSEFDNKCIGLESYTTPSKRENPLSSAFLKIKRFVFLNIFLTWTYWTAGWCHLQTLQFFSFIEFSLNFNLLPGLDKCSNYAFFLVFF